MGLQRGYAVIPKSSHLEHQILNLDVSKEDFVLSSEDMEYLSSREKELGQHRICNKFQFLGTYDIFA